MTFLILLSVLVLVHELGHFWMARKFGVKVEEFGIGIPPKAKTLFRRKGTEFTLNWLPLGGFVRLLGEDGERIINPLKRRGAFYVKPAWQRSIILLAGTFMNFVLGFVIFSFVYAIVGVPVLRGERVVVTQVAKGSPADFAGIEEGDVMYRVGSEEIESVDEFVELVVQKKGEMARFFVGEINIDGSFSDTAREVEMIPRTEVPEGEGSLGVIVAGFPEVTYDVKPWYLAPFYGVKVGFEEAYLWSKEIVRGMGQMFSTLLAGKVPEGVSGPVGIWKATKRAEEGGLLVLARFAAILSINLGVFNMLPIPVLDGGRLLFLGVEQLFGKKKTEKWQNYINVVGLVLIVVLLLAVTYSDIFLIN